MQGYVLLTLSAKCSFWAGNVCLRQTRRQRAHQAQSSSTENENKTDATAKFKPSLRIWENQFNPWTEQYRLQLCCAVLCLYCWASVVKKASGHEEREQSLIDDSSDSWWQVTMRSLQSIDPLDLMVFDFTYPFVQNLMNLARKIRKQTQQPTKISGPEVPSPLSFVCVGGVCLGSVYPGALCLCWPLMHSEHVAPRRSRQVITCWLKLTSTLKIQKNSFVWFGFGHRFFEMIWSTFARPVSLFDLMHLQGVYQDRRNLGNSPTLNPTVKKTCSSLVPESDAPVT